MAMAELVGPTTSSDIPDRDGVRCSLERAGGLQYCAEGFGVRDEPSARRFPFALGGDGIGAPGQNPKFEFRLLMEQGNDFGDVIHGSPRGSAVRWLRL
jgi:hypothetical protein